MQREAEQRAGQTPGGLTQEDLGKLSQAEWEADRGAAAQRDLSREAARRREQQRSEPEPPAESVIDDVEAPDARGRIAEAFGGERKPLKVQAGTPAQNRAFLMRMASVGMALLGIFLLWQALQSQSGVLGTPSGPIASATPTATVSGPITQASPPVSGTATANASFTKVSGPCNLAARFNDRYSFMATNGALTLTQLSNNHVSRGTISPNGDFTTMAEGQGYRGTVSGTTARGQHTYTAQGCNEVYDFTMTFPTAFIGGGGAQQANRPPEAGAIRATQTGTTTSYTVLNVSDPDGDPLRYRWTSTNPCGPPTGHSTPTLSWPHPHPPCPEEPFHPATITVQIDDGRFVITRTYTGGSAPGTGPVPAAGAAISTIAPSPTAAPPTATGAAATATATAGAVVAGTSGVNIPLILIALILLIGALGLWFGGPRLAGGPVGDDPQDAKDPCEREKARLAAAQAAAAAADARMQELDTLAENAQSTQRDAAAKEQTARDLKRSASSGEMDGRTVYTNPTQRAAIEAADAAAASARAAADAAQSAYNAAGGAGARQTAADDVFKAHRELRDAQAALDACLRIVSLSTPTPAPGGAPTTGGGTTTGGTGGGIGTGTGTGDGTRTRERRECDPENLEEVIPEKSRGPERFTLVDMSSIRIVRLESDDANTPWAEIDAAMEYARNLRRGLSLGGKVLKRVAPDASSAMGPMGPVLNFTGTMTDKALEGLQEVIDIYRRRQGAGLYQLRYREVVLELACVTKRKCVNGRWVEQPAEFSITDVTPPDAPERRWGGDNNRDRVAFQPGGRSIADQISDVVMRYTRSLRGRNNSTVEQMQAFESSCGR